jgi:hypothetical protein
MKDILIAIPSRSRVEGLKKDTHSFVKHSEFPYKIFVEPQQYDDYLEEFSEDELIVLDKNDQGLCYAKKFIMKYCLKNKYKYVFKMDDDINNLRVRQITEIKKKNKVDRAFRTKNFLDAAIKDSLKLFSELGEQIKGVSFNYGQELRQEDPSIIWDCLDKRFQSNYIIETKYLFPYEEHMKCGAFEDFDTFFNLLSLGYNNVRHAQLGIDLRPVGKNEGGLQDFNRRQKCLEAMEVMSNRYPYLVWKEVKKDWDYEPNLSKTKEFKSIKIHG